MPMAAMPAQMPIALPRSSRGKTFVMIDRVAGMINAPPAPITRTNEDELVGGVDEQDAEAGPAEQQQPGLQRALAAEAVAERAHRQQQAGEHEQVRVDDPLQRRAGRAELLLQRGQRDVEDGVVEPDDHEAQGQHGEGLPAPGVVDGIDGHGRLLSSMRADASNVIAPGAAIV